MTPTAHKNFPSDFGFIHLKDVAEMEGVARLGDMLSFVALSVLQNQIARPENKFRIIDIIDTEFAFSIHVECVRQRSGK